MVDMSNGAVAAAAAAAAAPTGASAGTRVIISDGLFHRHS